MLDGSYFHRSPKRPPKDEDEEPVVCPTCRPEQWFRTPRELAGHNERCHPAVQVKGGIVR